MVRNYIKIAIRNIFNDKYFSLINIFGLALSMSLCLLIISMIAGLSKYDRFHENYDRIYRVLSKKPGSGFKATSPMPIRNALTEEYSGIEKVVTFKQGFGGDASYGNTTVPLVGMFCSEELFDVFSFTLEKGNPVTALQDPYSVVLTRESAKKLFGNEDPMDKVIRFSERGLVMAGIPNKNKPTYLGDYTVKGVMAENPGKTHIEFNILASMSTLPILEKKGLENALQDDWKNIDGAYSYLLLEDGRDRVYLQSILDNIANHEYAQSDDFTASFAPQPLAKITPGKLYGNPLSFRLPITVIYILAVLAVIVIISACFNYTNLSLARSLKRAKEVGIRKVSGAYRIQIIGQLVGESILISVISLVFAIGILELLKPAFNSLWFTQYLKVDFSNDILVFILFLLFSIFIGFIAGILPAIYLSSFKPIKVLKDVSGIKMFKKLTLRKVLIITQFAVSLFFIISTTLIYFQFKQMIKTEYGFNKENIVNVPLHGNEYHTYANAIKNHSGIQLVSGSSIVLTTGGSSYTYLKKPDDPEDSLGVSQMSANPDFITNLGLRIIAGSNFPETLSDGTEQYFLINEKAVAKFGYDNAYEIVGESFWVDGMDHRLTVIGVLKDFHYSNPIEEIGPFIIRYIPDNFRYVNIRINPDKQDNTLAFLGQIWKKIDTYHAFEPEFMEDQLIESQGVFSDTGYIIGFISVLAVTIACLGLLGMVLFVTQTRVKEIGIRKVHGATINDVVLMLSKGFLIMLGIATLIATPLAKMANELWLREFPTRVKFGWEILGMGIMIMLILGFITIFSQTIKTARTNPSDALRYE